LSARRNYSVSKFSGAAGMLGAMVLKAQLIPKPNTNNIEKASPSS